MSHPKTFLCISCEFKGGDFIRALHELGQRAFLVTSESARHEAWPRECLEDIFFMPEGDVRKWDIDTLIKGTAHLFRHHRIDKIIALDDYDVWKAADLREEFRSPGMGQTTARHFYDKLSMRMVAKQSGVRIPGFSPLFNDEQINEFLDESTGPWVVKPRTDAGALGIRKIHDRNAFWAWSDTKGDERHNFLIEEFKPGAVYHVDSLLQNYTPLFTRSSKYLQPPFEVAHEGGIFRSQTLDVNDPESQQLESLNAEVLKAFRLNFGASHSEFIKSEEDGEFYFLETSARVGGAHLAEMVEAASGINLWKEWARIELAVLSNTEYTCPESEDSNAGIVVTLSKVENTDYSHFSDPSIWWTLNKRYHVGLIFKDTSHDRIRQLLDQHTDQIFTNYHTSVPLKE